MSGLNQQTADLQQLQQQLQQLQQQQQNLQNLNPLLMLQQQSQMGGLAGQLGQLGQMPTNLQQLQAQLLLQNQVRYLFDTIKEKSRIESLSCTRNQERDFSYVIFGFVRL